MCIPQEKEKSMVDDRLPLRSNVSFVRALSVTFCACVLLLFSLYGGSRRAYSSAPHIRLISEPSEAYTIWQKMNVRGRVLLLFDRRLNANEPDGGVPRESYVRVAVQESMVRSVYHVIPDRSWEEVKEVLLRFPLVQEERKGFHTTLWDGSPVTITRLGDLGGMHERVLININSDVWDDEQFATIFSLLRDHVAESDLVTISGSLSESRRRIVNEYAEGSN
jgi:hypothetical protein